MAHSAQQDFCRAVKSLFPEHFTGVNVCDIGSLDINGNNHYLFEEYAYIGVDVGKGKNVNIISPGHLYKPIDGTKYDTVISTECFEHDMYWDKTMTNICENLVRDEGMFIFTCATDGRPEHGTNRSIASDSPLTTQQGDWGDYYMNINEIMVREKLDLDKYFKFYKFYVNNNSHDLYFWGIKY